MSALLWCLVLLLACPAAAAAADQRPNAGLRQALSDSAQVVLREGEALLDGAGIEGPELREAGLRLIREAERMAAAAEELSAQAEQAARSVREESAALVSLAETMLGREAPLAEVARRLLAESERLRRSAAETPAAEPQEPFEGLATGVKEI